MIERDWYVLKNNCHVGPFSEKDILYLLKKKKINESGYIWREGKKNWQQLKDIEEFSSSFNPVKEKKAYRIFKKLRLWNFLKFKINHFSIKIPKQWMISLGIGILACSVLFPLGIFFLFGNPPSTSLVKLSRESRQRLKRYFDQPFEGKNAQFGWGVQKGGQGLTIVTNYPSDIQIFLEIKSLPNKVLGEGPIVMRSNTLLKNKVANIDEFILEKGSSFLEGEYFVEIKGLSVGWLPRLRNFLRLIGIPIYYQDDFYHKKKLLFTRVGIQDFQKKLKRFEQKERDKKRLIYEQIENYRTYLILLKSIERLYKGIVLSLRKGQYLIDFINAYHKKLGPRLRDLILLNNKNYIYLINSDPKRSQIYNRMMKIGKKFGNLVSFLVIESVKYRKRDKSIKSYYSLMKIIQSKFDFLQETIFREIKALKMSS